MTRFVRNQLIIFTILTIVAFSLMLTLCNSSSGRMRPPKVSCRVTQEMREILTFVV